VSDAQAADPRYLTEQLTTYLGNQRALLPFIGQAIEQVKRRLGRSRLRCFDVFSGSGVVSRYLKRSLSARRARLTAKHLHPIVSILAT